MNKKEIGLDRWQIQMQASSFLNLCKKQSIDVFDCTFKNSHISFYSPVFERMHIHHTFPDAVLLNTTGMLGYFFSFFKKACICYFYFTFYRIVDVFITVCFLGGNSWGRFNV